ncbi:MAG: hypothetical protein KAI71_02965 [Candidatus Pacebacteria bacterium]|nr:hypothetical protein [Candidatus Paceibacterota bacterium]
MIDSEEEKIINANVCNYYHLVDCNTHIFGEPFLEDNYLYYFDGKVITIISLRSEKQMDKDSLNDLIKKIIKKHSPQNIIFWGETPITEIDEQKGYKFSKKDIDLFRRELVFKTADFIPSKKYKYYLNKAEKEKLTINPVKSNYYKSEYTKLLSKTHNNLLDAKSLSYYSIFPNLKGVRFVEIRKGERIVSINIMIEAFPNYLCFAETGYEDSFNRISGITGSMLIKYYLDKAKYISWGGCANEGIFKFKKEITGETPLNFYDNYIWYEFYKDKKADWWFMKMAKE